MGDLSFGEWLSRSRKYFGLTQKQLAERINCATITLRKIEAEDRQPSAQIVEQLAQVFNIPHGEYPAFLQFARGDPGSFSGTKTENHPWKETKQHVQPHIPAALTSFVGRERDVAAVASYVLEDKVRLVTLVGPPGIGKTRLSHEFAREYVNHFPGGIFFVGLASVEIPKLIASTILQSIGLDEIAGKSTVDRLKDGIANKRMLIVLDNLEHMIEDAGSLVYDLLQACPRLIILATSREAMRLTGEQIYAVPALDTPAKTEIDSLESESAMQYSALRLFAERAKAAVPQFSLDRDNIRDISAICAHLDGLPLAIELYAARIDVIPPKMLLSRLDNHSMLHMRAGGSLDAHHKSLYHAINWSYELLSREEQQLFGFLSVFHGNFSRSAIEQVFIDPLYKRPSQRPAGELIDSLIEKSLIHSSVDRFGEQRLHMLETLQQFAAERLRESGGEAATREQHQNYFLQLSESALREIHGPDRDEWFRHLENEQDNLRTALNWSLTVKRTEQAMSLLTVLGWLWLLQANYSEILCWYKQIQSVPDVRDFPLAYAELQIMIGRLYGILGESENARSVIEEALEISRKSGLRGDIIADNARHALGSIPHAGQI